MKNLLLVLAIFIVVFSCRKDEEIPYCEQYPDDCVDVREVKDYFYFNYGSWWVYEEENSGKRDSVYVINTWTDNSSVLFSTELYSEYDGYQYRFWTTGVHPSVKKNVAKKSVKSTTVYRSKGKPGDYVGEDMCFLYYPMAGLSGTTTYISGAGIENYHVGLLTIEAIYTQHDVNGALFTDVVYVSEENNPVEEGQSTKHYYSPNIGLIKKELLDSNQIWNLVNYHIVK